MKIKYSVVKKRKIVKGDWVVVLDNPFDTSRKSGNIFKVAEIIKTVSKEEGSAAYPNNGGGMYEKYLRLATEEEIKRQKEEKSKS